ncbi:MAG: bifunctional [glutamine synthetase] adenylyltransferase/[glutamine synthetase]-adenylyl-L-tyrosine phosphorylase [Hyphomicrobiales bacterium]|nr:bifunctional [glutamine synthetase] adenylyltransferase/[glutamine synthetase]-adenylyl-L-tyrosine phosphorylase [Hyphomicrobiales bacterium]
MAKQTLPGIKPHLSEDISGARLVDPPLGLTPVDAKASARLWEDWVQKARDKGQGGFVDVISGDVPLSGFLQAAFELSPYLRDLANKHPDTVAQCHNEGFDAALQDCLAAFDEAGYHAQDEAALSTSLRIAKRKAALICGLADLGGWWSWRQVSQAISDTADHAVQATVRHLLHNAHMSGKLQLPDPDHPDVGSGYFVLAMGKHGAVELNFSSDIDLIVLFEPNAEAVVDPDESVKLFVRLTRSLVRILQERTADGYVFRTDLRLRPDPGSMPLAIPVPIALNYYESRGQNWERAALIKARTVAGDVAAGDRFLHELTPFIWRRYLDYAAIADVHSIKRQIQTHRGYNEVAVPGHNVKLGRGGIREIEFFVQTQQLIAGGRNPVLRERRTLEMLQLLVAHSWIDAPVAEDLAASYAFLRDVEHRLQIVADDQVHTLPEDKGELKHIAHLCGVTPKTFATRLVAHLEQVESHYAALFASGDQLSTEFGNLSFTGDDDDPGTIESLQSMGFEEPARVIKIIKGWHYGRHPVVQSATAREQLTALTPALLKAFVVTEQADETLWAFDTFLQGLPSGVQLFSVLQANAKLLDLLALVLSAAPRLAQIITRRPHVFDGVLEPGFFDIKPSVEHWKQALDRSLDQARDYEDGLDRVRIFAAEQRFHIGIRLISGAATPLEAGEMFSLLAETLLVAMANWVERVFVEEHGRVPGADYAIVAMGNLGTHELTAGSDLDVMLIYEYPQDTDESDGRRPLHASQYYGRFTQRLIAAMNAPTAQGVVYELDFRLRPNGAAGPLATSLMALQRHYREEAWTWEKLALTRARVLGEESPFADKVASVIRESITQNCDVPTMAKDILEMRALMDKERPAKSTWDVKLAKGGLIDIEFLTQAEILFSRVERGRTIAETLQELSAAELQNDNVTLHDTHANYLGVIQVLRLCLDGETHPQEGPRAMVDLLLRQLDLPDLKSAEAFLKDSQRAVRQVFMERLKDYAAHSQGVLGK